MTENCADLAKGDYLVIHEKQGEYAQIGDPEACTNVDLSVVFNNLRFTIYTVSPQGGTTDFSASDQIHLTPCEFELILYS